MGKVVRISDRTQEVINLIRESANDLESFYISDSDYIEIALLYYAQKVKNLDVENI